MLQNQSQSRESVRLEGTHQTWGPTVDVPVINGIWDTSVEPEPELPKQTRAEHRKNIQGYITTSTDSTEKRLVVRTCRLQLSWNERFMETFWQPLCIRPAL